MRKYTIALMVLAVAGIHASPALAGQVFTPTFSIDFQGPTIGLPDAWAIKPIAPDDILSPAPGGPLLGTPMIGPLPPPGVTIPDFALGLRVINGELDALSYGRDILGQSLAQPLPTVFHFSVDRFATGFPGPGPWPPDVFTEGWTGAAEAASDVFKSRPPMFAVPPPTPGMAPGWNTDVWDGDGLGPPGLPGLGLIESPGMPAQPETPKHDDNLDALDINTTIGDISGPVYFSLDSAFVDPLDFIGNTGTALASGFVGGDVLVTVPGAPGAVVYAPAAALGLDLINGPDTDDLDALALFEDGDGVYTPNDTLLFSVRRGSAIIGTLDAFWGAPIEEGDILTPSAAGGVPGIFCPAEFLGLATLRNGILGPFNFADDLNALDIRIPIPGDADDDGDVDLVDLGALATNYLMAAGWDGGDFNGDGLVNLVDLGALATNYGMAGGPAPIPEPATICLLALGGIALLKRKKD